VDVPLEEVVPGDVVLLAAGSLVPADGVILEAVDFFVSEAVLTGESFPVEKRPGPVALNAGLRDRLNCVFLGTNARSGHRAVPDRGYGIADAVWRDRPPFDATAA
jgi:Mg2+-importing ATPase